MLVSLGCSTVAISDVSSPYRAYTSTSGNQPTWGAPLRRAKRLTKRSRLSLAPDSPRPVRAGSMRLRASPSAPSPAPPQGASPTLVLVCLGSAIDLLVPTSNLLALYAVEFASPLEPSLWCQTTMTLKALCTPRPSVFSADRRATVLNLDTLLKKQVSGAEFFEENYFTVGMETLIDRAFRHLSGAGAGSPVFLLSQAMGGGKTHSMIALGLLAQDSALRNKVLGTRNPAPNLGKCRIAGFNGRNTDAAGGIWGSISEQLGKREQFAAYISPLLSAPGPEAWKTLLGGDPLVLFLDELPPYLEYAAAVPVGNADLSVVTTAALANLFIAVTGMDNVCLVLSDLAGTNFGIGQERIQAALNRAIQSITDEAKRIAVPITPVNPNGDELYHILRKRLFEAVAQAADIQQVAEEYREALREAQKMGLTTTSPESLYTRVTDAYPFHPDLRELVGKFKENNGFQQTRGVIRLMQMVVSDLWKSNKAASLELIHPYDLDGSVATIRPGQGCPSRCPAAEVKQAGGSAFHRRPR